MWKRMALVAAMSVLVCGPSMAASLFDSGPDIGGSGGPDLAEFATAGLFAVNADGTITGGYFVQGGASPSTLNGLTFAIYGAHGALYPGPNLTAIASGALTVTGTTDVSIPGYVSHYKTTFTLDHGFDTTAGVNYFLSISSPSYTDDFTWVLASFTQDHGYFTYNRIQNPGAPEAWFVQDGGLAFGLTGTLASDGSSDGGSTAPEPETWALLTIGFLSMGAMLRSQRRLVRGF